MYSNIDNVIYSLKELGYSIEKILPINFGKNSNSYAIFTESKKYFLKIYPVTQINNRKRLISELNFLNFLKSNNVNNISSPVNCDKKKNWILFNWINGVKINYPSEANCNELIKFICEIQNCKNSINARSIFNASEANFTVENHINHILERINKLRIKIKTIKIEKVRTEEILNLLNEFTLQINQQKIYTYKSNIDYKFKILSPSDVGFHNILLDKDKLYFIDFEYAGWDDPRKLISDLILQPQYNIPKAYFSTFRNLFKNDSFSFYVLSDLSVIIRLYRIKWVLIMLNPILYSDGNILSMDIDLDSIICEIYKYLIDSEKRINIFLDLYLFKNFT